MSRTPLKLDAGSPESAVPAPLETAIDDAPASRPAALTPVASVDRRVRPIPPEALAGLGLIIVGVVQIAVDGVAQGVPVGLAPYAGSDVVDVPRAGFFVDELGRCGILLNGNDGAWQKALPEAVEEARRVLTATSSS